MKHAADRKFGLSLRAELAQSDDPEDCFPVMVYFDEKASVASVTGTQRFHFLSLKSNELDRFTHLDCVEKIELVEAARPL